MNIFKELIKKIPLDFIFGLLLFITLFFTFGSNDFLNQLDLLAFKNQYHPAISISLLISAAWFICRMFSFIYKKIIFFFSLYLGKKTTIQCIDKLNEEEWNMLISKYYDYEKCRFKKDAFFEINDHYAVTFENMGIHYRMSTLSKFGYLFSYSLQPFVYEILNNYLNRKKLIITKSKLVFKN